MNNPLTRALNALPHGPEFRFLDELTDLDPGRTGIGRYQLRGDAPFLRGHFPGDPLMPGVLLVEAAAQLAGTVAQSDPKHPPLPGLKLAAIRNARFLGAVHPGEQLVLQAHIIGRIGRLIQAVASASVDGRTILKVELILSGDPPETRDIRAPVPGAHD
jgi:3-hydroxyacyl-[acyl-carrier-protein] dehydratase